MNCLTLQRHADGLAEIVFDRPGKSVNTLDIEVFAEVSAILDDLEKKLPRALLVRSGKLGQFIAGADVAKIGALFGHADAARMASIGRDAFTRFSRLSCPTAALITGSTLGGGLEWALACDWIICADDAFIRIGLPEVQLGILPAWGGTSRLPRRVGLMTALDMILQGKKLDPQRARKAGLVDAVAPVNQLPQVAEKFLAKGKRRAEPPGGLKNWLLTGNPLGLKLVFSQAEKAVAKSTRGHYPAPTQILTALKTGWGAPIETALKAEAEAVAPLLNSSVAKNLVGIFLMSEAAKKNPYADESVKPAVPKEAMVIGAGVMGSGIAVALLQGSLQAGARVWLKEVAAEPLIKGVREVEKWLAKDAARKRSPPAEARAIRQRLAPVLTDDALRDCDLVIEAVVEKLEVKRAVFAACEAKLPADALLTTNTSSLPVSELQKGAMHPERIAGLHFFNPAPLMPLVEIIRGEKTSRESLARLHALVVKLGKTPVVVKDGPGFLVNRLLAFYLNESAAWLAEGVPVPVLDDALKNFGMPMGPAELMDVIGLDVAVHAGGVMEEAWPDRAKVPALLKQLVTDGRLGKKTGKGFYSWTDEKKAEPLSVPNAPTLAIHPSAVDLVDRCILPMVNEAATCLHEGVVDSPAALDLAMIFGTGFAPFRGGLLRYADAFTPEHAISRLETLAKAHGPHLAPGAALKAMAGKKFYGE